MTARQSPNSATVTRQMKRLANIDPVPETFIPSLPYPSPPASPQLSTRTVLRTSVFGKLPRDIWESVFSLLLPADLVTVSQLNSTFHATVTTSLSWRFYRELFPTSRRIWALCWDEARAGFFDRTAPPT